MRKMREMTLGNIKVHEFDTFDTIFMLGHNFGLLENPKRARELLGVLHRMTSPEAKILATTLDPRKTDDPLHKSYQAMNKQRGRPAGQIRMRVRYKNLTGEWFEYLFVSPDTMRLIIAKSGWKIERISQGDSASYLAVLVKETKKT